MPRRISHRSRSVRTGNRRRTFHFESLEARRMLSETNGVDIEAIFDLRSGSGTPRPRDFEFTSLSGDPNGDGIVNTPTVTFTGEITPALGTGPNEPADPLVRARFESSGGVAGSTTVGANTIGNVTSFSLSVNLNEGTQVLLFEVEGSNRLDPNAVRLAPVFRRNAMGQSTGIRLRSTLTLDTQDPTVLLVTSNTPNGTYGADSVINVRVRFSEAMIVTGSPTLRLETGQTDRNASFVGIANDDPAIAGSETLVFEYVVRPGDQSPDLDYVNTTALMGGTIRDIAGNPANRTLPAPGAAGSLSANKNLVINAPPPAAPDLAAEDDTGPDPFDPSDITDFNSDNITRNSQDLTFTGQAPPGASGVQLRFRDRSGSPMADQVFVATVSGGAYSATVDLAVPSMSETPFDVVALFLFPNGDTAESANLPILIDQQSPAQLPPPDLTTDTAGPHIGVADDITTDNSPDFSVTSAEINARVSLRRNAIVVASRDPLPGTAVTSITDDPGVPENSPVFTFNYSVFQTDLAGNIGPNSPVLPVVVDTREPSISNPRLAAADQIAPTILPTPVTHTGNPTFEFELTEQRFSSKNNRVLLELVEVIGASEVPVASREAAFAPSSPEGDETRTETLSGGFAAGPHQIVIRATDAAGNTRSASFAFFVTQQTAATTGAPSTPVFSSYYDINAVAGGDLEPWTMAFDNTTQTVWFTMEKGKRVGHFDPASQTLQVYDLSNFGVNSNNPHGIFFDFDSHLTPRVWFAHRNGNGVGRLSYLDVAADQFVTFDFGTPALEALGVRAAHAVVVDQRGTVWVTSEGSNKLLEIDFDQVSQSGFNLNSRTARFKVHDIPVELFAPEDAFEPHGIKVVLNDEPLIEVGPDGISRTYLEVFAWFTSQGPNGRVALLRTFQQVLGPGSPKQDEWTTWDLSLALLTESSDDNPRVGHALFVETDDNETPGNPRDDKIVIADPGFRRAGMAESPAGVVRVLDPRAYFANAGVLTSPVETWRVPSHPGAPLNHQFADTIQPFVDRGGTIFFADRTSGVGRFSSADPEPPSSTINAPILRTILPPVGISAELTGVTVGVDRDSLVLSALSLTSPENTNDHSQVTGFDQYVVAGPDAGNAQGQGLFRAFLNAGSIFYGSIAQNDALSTTVFAESARRQMASVVSPTQLPPGVVRGRMAFQVLRDGRVILTGRGDGVILDRQIDLTQLLRQNAANNAIPGLRMSGDPSATIDANGVVSIFGLADDGTLLVYQYQGSWNHDSLFAANNWTAFKLEAPAGQLLIGDPTAFTDSTGRAKAMVTTNDGHLLLYEAIRSSSPIDLFQQAGRLLPVYSSVGVVTQGGRVFAHGTNQRGELIQYSYLADAPNLVVATTVAHVAGLNPAQTGVTQPRDAFVFQAVDAILAGGKRHVFAMDGNSRLVHFEFDTDAPLARVTNVTNVAVANNQSFGYFNFQQPFGGRTYTELAPVVGQDGTVYIYGTNGRDLVEFKKLASGGWQAANLTNDIFATEGAARPAGSRVGANEVFGAPTAYIQPDGERHILQINDDGEVVEYFFTPQTSPPRFHTQNINLASGNQFSGSSQVSVSVTPAGVLVVTGDSGANGVAITGTGAPGQYVVTGLDLGGTPTAVNGLPNGTVTVDGVFTTIDVNLGDGDDYVSIDNAFLGGSIYIRTGSGNDTVQVGTRQIVTMREDMVIDLAQGNDQLDLQRSYVVRHLVVDGGDGDDSLRPNNASTLRDFVLRSGNGADTLNVRQVAVVGSWLIDAGADSDNVSLTNSAATGAAAFFLRDGNDSIALDACFFNSSFLIDGDGGQDLVEMSGVIANTDASLVLGSGDDQARVRHSIIRALVIDGADGNDRAEISTSLLDDLFASLGAGDDHLSLITNRIRRSHFLDGGPGSDELLTRSNDPSALSSTQFERRSS